MKAPLYGASYDFEVLKTGVVCSWIPNSYIEISEEKPQEIQSIESKDFLECLCNKLAVLLFMAYRLDSEMKIENQKDGELSFRFTFRKNTYDDWNIVNLLID